MAFIDMPPRLRLAFTLFYTFCIVVGAFTFGWFACYEQQPLAKLARPDCIVWK